jgi:hypothetical protein
MSVGKRNLDKLTVGKISVDLKSVGKKFADKIACSSTINIMNHRTQHQMKENHTTATDWKGLASK